MRRLVNIVKRLCRPRRAYGLALTLAGVVILTAAPAVAEIYRYVDVDGVIHYTDDIDNVPAKYQDNVQQQKSLRSSKSSDPDIAVKQPTVKNPDPGESPDYEQDEEGREAEGEAGGGSEAEGEAGDNTEEEADPRDSTENKRELEEERQALLEQKEALANNKTYQKRKIKRRYINRPHIQELAQEEARIDERLQEIEKELQ